MSRLHKYLLASGIAVLALSAACEKESVPPPAQPEPVDRSEAEIKIDTKPTVALPPLKLDEKGLPDQNFIYNAIARFTGEKNRRPRNLEELIATGYLPPLPTPPAGKKYILNVPGAVIELADAPKK